MPDYEKIKDFAEQVEQEGIGYAILRYYGADITSYVDDPELIWLWKEAHDALKAVDDKLKPFYD